jgi:hypothetical protein
VVGAPARLAWATVKGIVWSSSRPTWRRWSWIASQFCSRWLLLEAAFIPQGNVGFSSPASHKAGLRYHLLASMKACSESRDHTLSDPPRFV